MINTTPLVAIKSLIYNHAPFLRQCLDGFVMQQTNFPFVAIVHDDASTDGSADIIREYAEKYPHIIKPIFETENQYSKKDGSIGRIIRQETEKYNPKYIAMCEGDDYWTDPLKLQKQVDFLESHPDYVMCSHACTYFYQESGRLRHEDLGDSRTYDLSNLAVKGEWLFQPVTIVYRSSPELLENYHKYATKRDAALIYSLLSHGKGFLIGKSMANYRVHPGGVWSKASEAQRWDSEFSVRKGIYEVEQTAIAAQYLANCLKISTAGRRHFLKRHSEVFYILNAIRKHKGMYKALTEALKLPIKQ